MDKSLAMIEYSTVSSGMVAANLISKTADIRLLTAKTVCPGKYLVLFDGELSSLKIALEALRVRPEDRLVDSFILGNPHPSVINAIDFRNHPADENTLTNAKIQVDYISTSAIMDTLGIIETKTSASAVISADTAVKAAKVELLEIRLANRMCGKAYVLFTGSLASVKESSDIVAKNPDIYLQIIDSAVIPAADKGFIQAVLRDLNEGGF